MHLDAQLEGEYLLNFDLMVLSVSLSEAYFAWAWTFGPGSEFGLDNFI